MQAVDPMFDLDSFVARCVDGFDDLELTPRARQIADALAEHLPTDRGRALDLIVASFGPALDNLDPDDAEPDPDDDGNPMAGFFYMPHGYFIAGHGLEHFEQAMRANYELTKRFTAEFSIRPYLVHHPQQTLAKLAEWSTDPNVHVRRLVSEGTRPRLPWASRLDAFIADPAPVIALLERLRDDPDGYVRRSVANNLNDIAKDHPDLVVDVCERWWSDGDEHRRHLVRHALRTLVKRGDPRALEVLGYRAGAPVAVDRVSIEPGVAAVGGRVCIEVDVVNTGDEVCAALVDLRVGFVGSNGSIRPKVFKGRTFELEPRASGRVRKTISVAQHSTRKHYPGTHPVEVLVNGVAHEAGAFVVEAADNRPADPGRPG